MNQLPSVLEDFDLKKIQAHADRVSWENKAFIKVKSAQNKFLSINPSTKSINCEIQEFDVEEVDRLVKLARKTFDSGIWSKASLEYRKEILLKLANLIEKNAYTLALLDTIDMGMPLQHSYNLNVKGAINCFRWYAECIDKVYDHIAPTKHDDLILITREPMGVVGAIVAWNVPLLVAATKIAPALATGNSVILKPAEQSSLSAIRLAHLALEAGIPEGVFGVMTGRGEITGKFLALHPDVDCITFTGSTEIGKLLLQYAGQSNMKKVCLECGGKSPLIIFSDTYDLEQAAQAAASSIFLNQGQICIASSRLLVQENLADDFIPLLIKHANQFIPDNPLDPKCNFGPLVDECQFKKVLSYIDVGKIEKANLIHGGKNLEPKMNGYYIEPTIFTNVNNQMRIAQEEIFGPILSIMAFKTMEQAIKIANDTKYGLGAGIWTSDLDRAHLVSQSLKAGVIRVNTTGTGGFVTPFGGYKQSGVGRDKSIFALQEYTELKSTIFNFKSRA
jgi:4-guanidinobutyraldehyde dehydrogenase / NAD-dependent aldehyde dehydrogenase